MDFSQKALLLVVVLVLLPAAFKNFTAFALLLVYALLQLLWFTSSQQQELPRFALWLTDITVLAMLYMKQPAYDCFPYPSRWAQLFAMWLERSWCDRVVIACFVAAIWPAYIWLEGATYYWVLFWATLAQYLAAACEALLSWRSAKAPVEADRPPSTSAPTSFSWGWAGGP